MENEKIDEDIINSLEENLKIQKEINSKSKEYIFILESMLAEKNNSINNLSNESHLKGEALFYKNKELAKQREKLNNINSIIRENEYLKHQNDLYRNSKSWKITKPLRALKRVFK